MAKPGQGTLKDVALLSELSGKVLSEVEKNCTWKHYGPNEQIIDRQSETRDVFFVIEGQVRVVNYSLSGRDITFDDLDAGSHFGELAAIDGQPRSAGVMSLTRSLIAILPPEYFLKVLEKRPAVALKVMTHLAHIVRTSNERVMDLSTLGANNRVHAELLRQAKPVGNKKNEAVIKPIPVHGDIASRVSTTRETVARVMNDLARRGIVERLKGSLAIRDLARLQTMVEQVRGE